MREGSQKDSDPLYTDAQLSKYQRLIRQATRWLFSGDVTERLDAAANADDALAALGPRKRKASKVQLPPTRIESGDSRIHLAYAYTLL